MRHPRTRAERRAVKKKEFNRKYFLSQVANYPTPYCLTYAKNSGCHTNRLIDYDFEIPGDYKNYCSWRGKYRAEKIYFRQLDGGKRYAYFKKKANHRVRRSQDFSTRKSNDYRKVYDYIWEVY